MAVKPEFWRGKRVFLTGHTGFKGGWLCLWLQKLAARVTGYALSPPTTPNLYEAARVGEGMTSMHGDVRDFDGLRRALRQSNPDIVFHLAAQSLVRQSFSDPLETYSTNVMGTANLLEAVRTAGSVRVVVNVTSDKCYEPQRPERGHRELDPMGGHDPYSSSKGCAELVTAAYRRSFFSGKSETSAARIATARAGNVIGGGDWANGRLVPDLVAAFAAKRRALIRNPAAVRPWQHVLDPLSGYLMLAERLWTDGDRFAEAWNFGPLEDHDKTVSWIADRMVEIWGASAWKHDPSPHPPENPYLRLDASKARAQLGWVPRLDIDTALRWTAEWYRGYLENASSGRRITESQIARYESGSVR